MANARYLVGDVRERMAELPDGSVDLIMCSPPFLALRSYLPADHPDKAKEIGGEPTPAAFVDTLLALTAEWRRLLAPHGSIAIELGDTYSGAGGVSDIARYIARDGYGGAAERSDAAKDGTRSRVASGEGWPLAKSLCLIPELYRIGLVYGINPLTGTPSPAGQWRARNVVRWHRPNPPVGALGDKYRPATSDMVIACISGQRYFDLDAVREPHNADYAQRRHVPPNGTVAGVPGQPMVGRVSTEPTTFGHPAGAPPLDTWVIPTEPYKGSHYATWPRDLCVKPIASMCPEQVCLTCGAPRRRIVEQTDAAYAAARKQTELDYRRPAPGANTGHTKNSKAGSLIGNGVVKPVYTTLGWSDCGHGNYRRGVVLDPFAGTGTTLAVATGLGRDAIGIDLDARNQWLARERVGMFLDVEERPHG